jgi:hypothetical protein
MNYLAEKIIGLVLCTVFGVTALTGAPSASGTPSSTTPIARDYLIEPTTTTSSTIYIDPYSSACEQALFRYRWRPKNVNSLNSVT